MHGGQGGFTLIELLVVIAILGVIAAIVALNVGTFFGRGTLQAANTELHQVQTAVISLMADAESGTIMLPAGTITWDVGGVNYTGIWWPGGSDRAPYHGDFSAASYVYGPFRASYLIDTNGNIHWAVSDDTTHNGGYEPPAGAALPGNAWSGIRWNETNRNWEAIP